MAKTSLDRRRILIGATAAIPVLAAGGSLAGNGSDFKEVTDRSKKSIQKAKAWLLKAINKDGGTGLDLNTPSDVACTGVTGLAFLSLGENTLEGENHKKLKKLADFLLNRVDNMGSYGSLQSTRSRIEGDLGPYATHFFATQCLSQMAGEYPNTQVVVRALRRLVGFISNGQLADGSWGRNAWAPMLSTACGWLALRCANFSGIAVPGSSEKAGAYLIRNMPKLGASWGTKRSWYHRLYSTAAGLRVLYSLEKETEEKAVQALSDILKLVTTSEVTFGRAGGEEYLTFQLMTDMLLQSGGPNWKKWYPRVRDNLIKYQNKDGSWTGHHCITSRTFSTACAMMVLTAPNRFLPMAQV